MISLFLVLFTIQAKAQQNFIITLKIPPPGKLNASDIWNVTVINNSGSDQSGYLSGTAKEDKDGMIAKGTTVPIMFKKGVNNIKIKDLPKTPDVEYLASDPKYKESLIRQGKFPSGNYEICVKVISDAINEELGSDCINQEVLETGLLSLINPSDEQEIDSKSPVIFTWSPGGKIPKGGFTLKICEIMNEQSPETAIKSNRAHFEKSGIKLTNLTYPNSAKKFEAGKKYAWKVTSRNIESEVSMFIVPSCGAMMITPKVECSKTEPGMYTYTLTCVNPATDPACIMTINNPVTLSAGIINTMSLALPQTVNPGQTLIVTGILSATSGGNFIISITGPQFTGNYTPTYDLPGCGNNCCDHFFEKIQPNQVIYNGTLASISPMFVSTAPIKKVTADIISCYKILSGANCSGTWPVSCIIQNPNMNNFNPVLTYSGEAIFYNSPGIITDNTMPVNLSIQFGYLPSPPCPDMVRFCVRYTFTDINCKTCDTVLCYRFQRNVASNDIENKNENKFGINKDSANENAFENLLNGEAAGASNMPLVFNLNAGLNSPVFYDSKDTYPLVTANFTDNSNYNPEKYSLNVNSVYLNSGVDTFMMPSGVDPCGSEELLKRRMAEDPALREKLELYENISREAEQNGLLRDAPAGLNPVYCVPVVVHIVHQGGVENISDDQVLSQIDAINRDLENLPPNPSPAVNTRIKLYLATNLPPGSPVTWSTTPGITRTSSSETNHAFGTSPLKAIDYLPADRYVNIWVVKNITGGSGGIVGYATFPGTGPLQLDGIVMRYDVFGSNHISGYGPFQPFSLISSNDDGKVLTHELGHYLNLYHTFHGGCTSPGDYVSDTPPEATNNVGCPTSGPLSCSSSPDPIENFMDYTNDPCRFAFTNGQTTRMYAAIGSYRSLLVSPANLIYTGCPCGGLNAIISASPTQLCAGGTVQFNTPTPAGYTYEWTFPGGVPASATTQSVSVNYPTSGTYVATLTVNDPSSNFSTTNATIYVVNCTPITGPCANWVFGTNCRLNFATGMPVAVNGTQNGGTNTEAAAQISDNAGNLLFYSNANEVWGSNNLPMPNGTGIFGGTSSHNGAIIVPRPGSSSQYFLFTVSQQENGSVPNPVRVTTIDRTLNGGNGDVVTGQKNIPVVLPGSPQTMLEGQALIPHCNGVDWWFITHGAGGASGKIFVTLVKSAGPVSSIAYPIGMAINTGSGNRPGTISPSPDGSKFAICGFFSYQMAVYSFNRTTGIPTALVGPANYGKVIDVCFSPNGNLLYYSAERELRQMDIATLQQRSVGMVPFNYGSFDVELGPDQKVYVGMGSQNSIGCVNFPDNFNTINLNECGYNPGCIPLGSGTDAFFGALPNTLQMCITGTQPAQFTYTVTNCLTVQFHAVNCSGPYSWNFGDGSPLGTGQNVTHTYSGQGTFNVTLTVTGASPPQQMQTLVLQVLPVSIAGLLHPCINPSNYSAVGPTGYTYQWTVTGGNPVSSTGNNVDVSWGSSGGTVTLTATDPTTGCQSSSVLTVNEPCPCETCKDTCCQNINEIKSSLQYIIDDKHELRAYFSSSSIPIKKVMATIVGSSVTNSNYGINGEMSSYFYGASNISGPITGLSGPVVPTAYFFPKEVIWGSKSGPAVNLSALSEVKLLLKIPLCIVCEDDLTLKVKYTFEDSSCVICDTVITYTIHRVIINSPWEKINKKFDLDSKDPINVGLNKVRAKLKSSDIGKDIEEWYTKLNETNWVDKLIEKDDNVEMAGNLLKIGRRVIVEGGKIQKEDIGVIEKSLKTIQDLGVIAPNNLVEKVIARIKKCVGMSWDEAIDTCLKIKSDNKDDIRRNK